MTASVTDITPVPDQPDRTLSEVIPLTHGPETGARNRRQKTGVGFWRRFLDRVSGVLEFAPHHGRKMVGNGYGMKK